MRFVLVALLLVLPACRTPKPGESDTPGLTLTSLKGTRDGDRLDVRALYSTPGGPLTIDLHFAVGVPTKLRVGVWTGAGESGTVQEKSTTFLGGQDGPPSIGGRFDLLGSASDLRYRISIPVQPLKAKL